MDEFKLPPELQAAQCEGWRITVNRLRANAKAFAGETQALLIAAAQLAEDMLDNGDSIEDIATRMVKPIMGCQTALTAVRDLLPPAPETLVMNAGDSID